MCTLVNAFADRGFRTDLVLARKEGPYLSDIDQRVRVISFETSRPIFALGPLVRYLRKEQPHALLSALDHTNLVAVAARHLSRTPIRHVVSQRVDPSITPSLRREPLEIFNYVLLGFGYRHADAVVAVSTGVARALEQRHGVPGEMIHVVYNSVEIQDEMTASEGAKHPWLAAEGPPLILGAGRLTRQKGFDTLLAAFQMIRADRPARLVILGTGAEERPLASLSKTLGIKEDVLFGGFVRNPWEWMRRADVFALSSRWEGLPGVLLQAMACGTKVVSTDCPSGPSEILEDGKWGRLVSVDDAPALARAILDSLDETDSPPVIQRANEFNLESMVDRYIEVLHLRTENAQP